MAKRPADVPSPPCLSRSAPSATNSASSFVGLGPEIGIKFLHVTNPAGCLSCRLAAPRCHCPKDGRPLWAESAPTGVALGRTGVRAIAVVPSRARNSPHRPKHALIKAPANRREGRTANVPRAGRRHGCANSSLRDRAGRSGREGRFSNFVEFSVTKSRTSFPRRIVAVRYSTYCCPI